jgi:hypothetical protein
VNRLAALVLVAGYAKHYGNYLAIPEWRADVQNIVEAAIAIAVLSMVAWKWRQTLLVAILWIAEEALVIGCSGLYIYSPWERKSDEDQCSGLIGFDLASIGLLAVGVILLWSHLRK